MEEHVPNTSTWSCCDSDRFADVMQVVAFLCSDKAAFLTGVAIPVDGGLHLGKLTPAPLHDRR